VSLITIRGDFNHKDEAGRVRLDTPDSREDLDKLGAWVRDGVRVLVFDEGGYQAECILEKVDGEWRARMIHGTGKTW
jgi:hypothetical protein